MAIFEQASELSVYKPAGKKLTREAKGQLILNAVRQNTSTGALRLHSMRVFPTAKRARNLDVPELASFDVVAVFEHPANSKWSKMNAKDATIAVVDSWCPLHHFYRVPRWCQSFKRGWIRVPAKNFLGGRINSRLCDELKQVGHISGDSPTCVWCIETRERASYRLPVLTGATSAMTAEGATSQIPI
jgi:hypothetical protein